MVVDLFLLAGKCVIVYGFNTNAKTTSPKKTPTSNTQNFARTPFLPRRVDFEISLAYHPEKVGRKDSSGRRWDEVFETEGFAFLKDTILRQPSWAFFA